MNAAFAGFWARLFGDDKFTLPYRSAGHGPAGSQLLRIFDETPADPAHDRTLIDAWGKTLGLDGWFGWTPYRLD
jgi:hypothetical protein